MLHNCRLFLCHNNTGNGNNNFINYFFNLIMVSGFITDEESESLNTARERLKLSHCIERVFLVTLDKG